MIRAVLFLLAVSPLCGQTAAGMLARLSGSVGRRRRLPPAPAHSIQMDVYATVEWTHHCNDTRDGVIREDFFYVFGEPARTARLRVDVRAVDESPQNTARLLPALERRLTARFGAPTHEPELMEVGFRPQRYGQPVAGSHWKGSGLHYFLHANLSASQPMGIRRGVQLVVITDRLFDERTQDALILRVEGFSGEVREEDNPVRARLKARIGAAYVRAMAATPAALRETVQDLTAILHEPMARARPAGHCAWWRAMRWSTNSVRSSIRRRRSRDCSRATGETGRHDALRRVGPPPRVALARLAGVAGDRGWRVGVSRIAAPRLEHGSGRGLPEESGSLPRGDR